MIENGISKVGVEYNISVHVFLGKKCYNIDDRTTVITLLNTVFE
jgi:hypothetical protein